MNTAEKLGTVGSASAVVLALLAFGSGLGPIAALPLLVGGLVIGWRRVPGFWRTVLAGIVGGAVAGLVILGPGLRLAMRVVAILDPETAPEFTWSGTIGIVLFVGGISGALLGLMSALMRRLITPGVVATVVTVVFMGLLLAGEDLRTELMELGAGPWVNLPMFTAVVASFALVMLRLIGRFERTPDHVPSVTVAQVQA
jgi:hypothetical protein